MPKAACELSLPGVLGHPAVRQTLLAGGHPSASSSGEEPTGWQKGDHGSRGRP